ncbi:MAG: hypothetical protein HYZ24_19045 [Chloroflexi bacterium]|nr:hypothetical protein [Chloroflexota bacterium]
MKNILWAGILTLAISASLVGCGPATVNSSAFAGTWTTNLGAVNIVQKGDELTATIEGYGGNWNEVFTGTVNGDNEAVFDTEVLGEFTLVLSLSMTGDTFESTSTELSFCGIRGANMELPSGCGFSGKWIVPSKSVFLPGSYMILTQVGENVTGTIYDGNDKTYETFAGVMEWGKGWRANGEYSERGEISLWMNASETGFQFMTDKGNIQELCAVREGAESAYLGSFYCEP